jgi:predicted RNase H-like HicB family nuclease
MATRPQPTDGDSQSFQIEYEQETDGRWLAEVPSLPGVMAYGATKRDAEVEVTALALRIIADRTQEARKPPKSITFL